MDRTESNHKRCVHDVYIFSELCHTLTETHARLEAIAVKGVNVFSPILQRGTISTRPLLGRKLSINEHDRLAYQEMCDQI